MFTQVKDLEIPTLLVINMSDQMKRKGISLDIALMEERLDTKIVLMSARDNQGLENLKKQIINYRQLSVKPLLKLTSIDEEYFLNLEKTFPQQSLYKLWLVITQDVNFSKIDRKRVKRVSTS